MENYISKSIQTNVNEIYLQQSLNKIFKEQYFGEMLLNEIIKSREFDEYYL